MQLTDLTGARATVEMMCKLFLSCSVFLLSCSFLTAHPVTDTAEMTYTGPDSVEEAGGVSLDDFSVSDLTDLLQRAAAAAHSPLLNRDSTKMSGQIPKDALKEFLLEKPFRLISPGGGLWGSRRQLRKRGGGADCFWKYCV